MCATLNLAMSGTYYDSDFKVKSESNEPGQSAQSFLPFDVDYDSRPNTYGTDVLFQGLGRL